MAQLRGELFGGNAILHTVCVDEARDTVERFYHPLGITPEGSDAPFDMRFNAVRVGDLTAGYLHFGPAIRIITPDLEHYHIDLPLSGGTEYRNGLMDRVQNTVDQAAVFLPELPADIRWSTGCAQLCLMIDRQRVESELAKMLGRPVRGPVRFATAMDLTTPAARSWLDMLALVSRESERPDGLLRHPLSARNVENVLIDGFLLSQPHNYSDALAAPAAPARPRLVRQIVEVIDSYPEQPWSSGDMARHAGVSVRSLQDAFQRSLGIAPMAYLRGVRLERVHDDLSVADPGTETVTRIAVRWGFVHLGRFAANYRRRFGRSPSQTLRSPGL